MTSEPTILLEVVDGTYPAMINSWRSVHFVLNQSLARPAAIRLILALRDDPLKTESTGVLQHRLAVPLDMLAVANAPAGRSVVEAARQQRLAIDQRRLG